MPDEALATYVSLGRQLATQMAETNFRSLTAEPGWTAAQVEVATEHAIARMDIGARDLLHEKGADHGAEHWQAIWEAMEGSYRKATVALLRDANIRGGDPLQ
jgi:molybdopterin synthase catalytic subunit